MTARASILSMTQVLSKFKQEFVVLYQDSLLAVPTDYL
jgi:hypothetical protein